MPIKFDTISELMAQGQDLLKKLELARLKKQIETIATFLPNEILLRNERELTQTLQYVGVIMMTRIHGFTPLTEKYFKIGKGGIYRLTATLNAYIGALLEAICYYGADILNCSGEYICSVWKVTSDYSLYEIVHLAIVCALVLQQILSGFETEVHIALHLQISIACGNVSFSLIGDSDSRHFFMAGDPFNEIGESMLMSNDGDVIIGPGVWAHLRHQRYQTTRTEKRGFHKVTKIFYKLSETEQKKHFEEKLIQVNNLIEKHINLRQLLHSRNKFESSVNVAAIYEQFVQSLPERASIKNTVRFWKVDDLKAYVVKPVQDQVEDGQPVEYLTDIRQVTIQIIKLNQSTTNTFQMAKMMHEYYKIINASISEVMGVITNMYFYNKSIYVLVIFGIKSVRHDLESQKALRSAFHIWNILRTAKGITNVAASVVGGSVYCGVIGHPFRRVYILVSSAIATAAKLVSIFEKVVSCDKRTFTLSRLPSYYFYILTNIATAGDDGDETFEYNEDNDNTEPKTGSATHIIGRDHEYNLARSIIYKESTFKEYNAVCFNGSEGLGKTAILYMILDGIRSTNEFNIASIKLMSDSRIPYFCLTRLYRQLYDNRTKLGKEDIPIVLNIPRILRDQHGSEQHTKEDVAVRKYRILKCFRDLILSSMYPTVLFIDDIQYIDLQSWEIIDIVSSEEPFRMVATANFETVSWDLKFKISLNDSIKLVECLPLDAQYMTSIACRLLKVNMIPKRLEILLLRSCEGKPAYIQSCLLQLINVGSLKLKTETINVNYETKEFSEIFDLTIGSGNKATTAHFTDKYDRLRNEVMTTAAIALDLYDSLPPYQQFVIQTASVLGEVFIRTLLVAALKFPPERVLANIIQTLFEHEIFDCGSRYINSTNINTTQICCVCYFEKDFFVDRKRHEIPKYAYCKIIHFKNNSIQKVAYDLLGANHKQELHLMSTEILEFLEHYCPKCTRQPLNKFVNFGKFKDVLSYCNNEREFQDVGGVKEEVDIEAIRECIRYGIAADIKSMRFESAGVDTRIYFGDMCNCLEILSRNFKNLIYHSTSAGHLGKRIYFTMNYGFTLICMDDYFGAIEALIEARELCMVDAKLTTTQVPEAFRKLHMGKINFGLAKAYADMYLLNTAKTYLAVALRQYNIPSLALKYKLYNRLLCRSFLVNIKRIKPVRCHNTLARNDFGLCLSLCAKIFFLEGKYKIARLACAYSLYVLKSVNPSIPILYEAYCTAMDVYKAWDQGHTCERLQRYVGREFQTHFANNNTADLYSLTIILNNLFNLRCWSGDICGAIRMGFRILDISFHLFSQVAFVDVNFWLVALLMFNFRLQDCLYTCSIIKSNISPGRMLTSYYVIAIVVILRSGFYIESVDTIIEYAKTNCPMNKENATWLDYLFYSVICTYYIGREKYQLAMDWKFKNDYNSENIKNDIVASTLVWTIEYEMFFLLRNIRLRNTTDSDEKLLKEKLSLLEEVTRVRYLLNRPLYYIYKAWYYKIKNQPNRKINKYLKKAKAISKKHENNMLIAWIMKIELGWQQRVPRFESIPKMTKNAIMHMSLNEWSQNMRDLPIE